MRAGLVDTYAPLVRRLAARVYSRRVGSELEFADLVQLGMVGLLEAIDRYTPARGVRFEAYAALRIEGAILNGLPSYSELQRRLAFRRSQESDRAESLTLESEPESSALDRLADLAIGLSLGFILEDAESDATDEPAAPDNAYARVELKQMRRQLTELAERLPQAERTVIYRHYFQQQPFEEIARGMALTKGRISQIHHAALKRLRQRLQELRAL